MPTNKVTIPTNRGHELAAIIELPAAPPRAVALFAHCFTCSKDLKPVVRISQRLVERGFAVLRFDFTGLGQSGGAFSDTTFATNLEDLEAAAAFLAQHHRPVDLSIGHSLGGAAVLAVAERLPSVKAVATLAAPSTTTHLRDSLATQAPEIEAAGCAEVELAGRPFYVRQALLEDLAEDHVERAVANLRRALLIMHSPTDEVVGIDHAAKLYKAARHPKSFISLDGADHLLLERPADAVFAADMLSAWATRYLGDDEANEAAPELDHGEVLVQGGPAGFRNEVWAGGHHLLADEPTNVPGGTDAGPSPYGLLLASLGSCTAMTLRMYAQHKKLPLQSVSVRLRHSKVHAQDCADCQTQKGKIDEIQRVIEVVGELTDAQRQRLLEIADRCPVHRTLHGELKVRSSLAPKR